MVGSPGRGKVAQNTAVLSPHLCRETLPLNLSCVVFCSLAYLLSCFAHPLTQQFTDSLSLSDLFNQGVHCFVVAPLEFKATGLFQREKTPLVAFHCKGDGITRLYAVYPHLIAQGI